MQFIENFILTLKIDKKSRDLINITNPYYIDDEEDYFDYTDLKLPAENFIEDLVDIQDNKLDIPNNVSQQSTLNHIQNIDLSEKISLDISLSHEQIRISPDEQKFAVKLTIKENKLGKQDLQIKKKRL